MTRPSPYGQKRQTDPEDGTGREFPTIAPQTGEKIVKTDKTLGTSDPQVRATEGVKILGGPPTAKKEGVKRLGRDS